MREATEWTRWQEADKWSWDEAKRQRWAEGLWRHQQKRRLDRAALRAKIAAQEARQKLEVRHASEALPLPFTGGVQRFYACLEALVHVQA